MRHTTFMKRARNTCNIKLENPKGVLGVLSCRWGCNSKLLLKKLKRASLAQLLAIQPRD